MTPTLAQKCRYLLHRLRFGLPLAIILREIALVSTPWIATDAWVMWAWGWLPLAVLAGYGATVWGGSERDLWPGITVRCKPGGYVDDRTVIRSIEAWDGDPDALKGLTIVVYPGEPPEAVLQAEGAASQYYDENASTLYTGAEALRTDHEHMAEEYDKVVG